MKTIKGILLNDLQINMKFVGVLLFQEFPVTSIFSEKNMPIIKEWVDCDDNNDRYLIYKISKEDLKEFIDGEIDHFTLLKKATDGLIYIVDEADGNINSIVINSIKQIPNEYIPAENSFFNANDGVETKKIIEYFNLNEIKELFDDEYNKHLIEISKSFQKNIFNLHIKKGKGVSFGSIETNLLGTTLIDFDNLYREVSLDYYYGNKRAGNLNKDKKIELMRTNVFATEAASFSIFLKPKHHSQINLFEGKSELQIIVENIFSLFEISQSKNKLEENYNKYSDFVYKSYKSFLTDIRKNDINFDINWVDYKNNQVIKEDFTTLKANEIINNIEKIQIKKIEKINVKGKFRAINCNTGYFNFIDLNEENEYHGYFDKLILEGITLLNFTNIYNLSIERTIIKEPGISEPKIEDIILSYSEIKK